MSKLYYCGGAGGIHIIPGNTGRHWFMCSKCRWNPNYHDTPEHKEKVLAAIAARGVKK